MSDSYLRLIEKLSGRENYSSWKFQMKMHLIRKNLWECIAGFKENDSRDPEVLQRLSEKALAEICFAVNPDVINHIKNARTAQEAWISLEKAYEDFGLTRRLALLRKLFNLHAYQFPSMQSYVDATLSIAQQLRDINAGLKDEFIGLLLLKGLPEKFDPMITALESSHAEITADLIKTKLINEAAREVEAFVPSREKSINPIASRIPGKNSSSIAFSSRPGLYFKSSPLDASHVPRGGVGEGPPTMPGNGSCGKMPYGEKNTKPRRRRTAKTLFLQACKEEYKKKYPHEKVAPNFSSKCSEKWRTMRDEEKRLFHAMAEKEKERCEWEKQNSAEKVDEKKKRISIRTESGEQIQIDFGDSQPEQPENLVEPIWTHFLCDDFFPSTGGHKFQVI